MDRGFYYSPYERSTISHADEVRGFEVKRRRDRKEEDESVDSAGSAETSVSSSTRR